LPSSTSAYVVEAQHLKIIRLSSVNAVDVAYQAATMRGHSEFSRQFVQFNLINIAPSPGFTGLQRTHDGMSGFMEMLCGMLVLRRIAAANVTALHGQPKVNPFVAQFKTLLTTLRSPRHNISDLT
jgi:hypothetical protein